MTFDRPLSALVRRLEQHSPEQVEAPRMECAGPRPELRTIRHFRNTWSKLSVDRQVVQALERFRPDCTRRGRGDLLAEQGVATRHGEPWQGGATQCRGQSVRHWRDSQVESALGAPPAQAFLALAAADIRASLLFILVFTGPPGRHPPSGGCSFFRFVLIIGMHLQECLP